MDDSVGRADDVEIALMANRAVVCLTSWRPEKANRSQVLPLVPPGLGDQIRMLIVGPGEWLMVSDVIAGAPLRDRLNQHLQGQAMAVVDLSNGMKTVRVAGTAARDLLSKGCGLDLHPRVFPASRTARTRFAQLSVTMECVDPTPRFDLYVGRSYVGYLTSWLEDAALEFKGSSS